MVWVVLVGLVEVVWVVVVRGDVWLMGYWAGPRQFIWVKRLRRVRVEGVGMVMVVGVGRKEILVVGVVVVKGVMVRKRVMCRWVLVW